MTWLEEYGIKLPNDCVFVGSKKVRVATGQVVELAERIGGRFEVVGLAAAKKSGEWKPSSDFLRAFPATRRVVKASRDEAERFIRGGDLKARDGVERGYVAVKSGHLTIGCGFVRDNVTENRIAKSGRIKQNI